MPPKADVRRLLKKQQQERNKVAKITHPFAKYDQANRLVCVVCNSNVKSESVWQAHLGSQLHRDNIQKLKELKQQQQQQLKRRATSPSPPTSSAQPSDSKRMRLDEEQTRQDIELSQDESEQEQEDEEMGLPADFFDKQDEEEEKDIPKEVEETPAAIDPKDSTSLPSGFFDDPEEEARVQGTLAPEDQAKADLEKEVEMFNEAMMDVTEESKQVQEEDDETFWEERHLDITREQAKFDSRVEKLKQLRQTGRTKMVIDEQHVQEEYDNDDGIKTGLKTSVRQVLKSKPTKQVASMFDDDDEDDSDEEDDDEDWRAQQL